MEAAGIVHADKQALCDNCPYRAAPHSDEKGIWEPDLGQVLRSDLKKGAAEIADIIGLRSALKLMERFGGRKLSIPKRIKPGHRIYSAIGSRASAGMERHYGLEKIDIPFLRAVIIPARNRAIRKEYDQGASVNGLVPRYGISERMIRGILNAPD